jgi:hypothetical protein
MIENRSGNKAKFLQWFAIVLIIEIGLIHILNAQKEYDEAAYMGYLFAANFFGSLIAAWGIRHKQLWGWMIGLGIASGSIAGYIWSRTLGMPGMNVEEWLSPFGLVSMALEGVFILVVLFRPWKMSTDEALFSISARLRPLFPVVGMLFIAATSILAAQWDDVVKKEFGHHVASLAKVCSTPATSFADLEEQYGVEISLVATSMMDSIVDVRLKIVDPEKAHLFLLNQAALLVDQKVLILAPHMHSHIATRLKEGKIFTVFFPTQQEIQKGSKVSLVFGSTRTEAVVVQ